MSNSIVSNGILIGLIVYYFTIKICFFFKLQSQEQGIFKFFNESLITLKFDLDYTI